MMSAKHSSFLWVRISDKHGIMLRSLMSMSIVLSGLATGVWRRELVFNFILENIMKMIKKCGMLVCAILLSAASFCFAAEDLSNLKVAVVNVQQVLQQSPRVAELSKKLEGQFKARQAKIGDQQKALQDALEKFKKDSPTMNQAARDAMQKKIAADRADLVKQVVAYQQDLQKEQNKVMQGILGDLNGIVSKIAKDQKYNLVLDSQAVIFAADGTDITKDVAKDFNSKS
jgi:outer membrane protein